MKETSGLTTYVWAAHSVAIFRDTRRTIAAHHTHSFLPVVTHDGRNDRMNGRDVLGSLLISTMHRQFPRPRDTFMNPTRPGPLRSSRHFVSLTYGRCKKRPLPSVASGAFPRWLWPHSHTFTSHSRSLQPPSCHYAPLNRMKGVTEGSDWNEVSVERKGHE